MVRGAVFGRIADKLHAAVEAGQLIEHILEARNVHVGHELLAGVHAVLRRVVFLGGGVLPVIGVGELVGKLQKRLEFVRVKVRPAVLPVDKGVDVAGDAGLKNVGLRAVHVEDRRAVGKLCHRVLDRCKVPGVVVARDLVERDCRADCERVRQLIELAVRAFQRLKHRLDEAFTAQVSVCVNQLVEICQEALCRVLLNGHAVGVDVDHVRELAREHLGVELLDAGGIIVVRIILGIVAHNNPVGVARAVELDDRVAHVPIQIHAREGQDRLVDDACRVDARHDDQLHGVFFHAVVVAVFKGNDAAVGQNRVGIEVVGVDVALDPVDHLILRVGVEFIAVDVAVVVVVDIVHIVAGEEIVGRVGQLDGVARELAGGRVDFLEDAAAFFRLCLVIFVIAYAHNAGFQLTQLAAVFAQVDGRLLVAVLVIDVHVLPVAEIDVAAVIDKEVRNIEAVAVFVSLAELDALELLAVGVKMQKAGLVFALLIVVIHTVVRRQICGRIVAVGIAAVDCPKRAVGSGLNGIEIRASHPALRDLGQLEFGQFGAVAGFDVHLEQRRAVVVILDFLTVFVDVALLAIDDTAGEVEVRTRDRRGVHILNVVGNRKKFRLISVLAGAGRLFVVRFGFCSGTGTGIGRVCGIVAVFAASGKHAQQHHNCEQRRNHTIRFHKYSFPRGELSPHIVYQFPFGPIIAGFLSSENPLWTFLRKF